ncbi:140_t:CDS:2 [Acaulospora colombiana]|uniref:140_t:CDS:1 n=1 Tax=Acaulospora colombiana TaxID=27376 RepID=A0ACA9MG54_9GLOM|nr:140_t:CDS:2 [Acaulospora colombiana]
MASLNIDSPRIQNIIDGKCLDPVQAASIKYIPVTSPHTGKVIAQCPVSSPEDVNLAVEAAKKAFVAWSARTVKDRVQCLIRFHNLLHAHIDELAELIILEHGKNKAEAIASIAKGAETVEYAISLPQLIQGRFLEVSRGVTCQDTRVPLGVVASIVPFNFPIMVPMWTLPIAIATGNTLILKPSEKVPLTMNRVAILLKEAGIPDGVVNIINGTADAVNAIVDHPDVKAVTFVGTSHVANLVSERCHRLGKRVLALGGAKNHLIAAPDCNIETTSTDVVNSFTGCAASVLLIIGSHEELLDRIVAKASSLQPGSQSGEIGPVIDQQSLDKIISYIEASIKVGAKILVDGRSWTQNRTEGFWIGPTVILHNNKEDKALHDEIFGPVLSIYQCSSKEEAIEIENNNPYGNAACIYTTTGATAEWFTSRFSAGMCGVNIGVPVPREPFSFGGINRSKFGNFVDITGDGGMEFFTWRRKVTTRWGQENLDPKLRM